MASVALFLPNFWDGSIASSPGYLFTLFTEERLNFLLFCSERHVSVLLPGGRRLLGCQKLQVLEMKWYNVIWSPNWRVHNLTRKIRKIFFLKVRLGCFSTSEPLFLTPFSKYRTESFVFKWVGWKQGEGSAFSKDPEVFHWIRILCWLR